jgi:hypothetical protein
MVCDRSCVGNPCLLGMQKCEMGVKWNRDRQCREREWYIP